MKPIPIIDPAGRVGFGIEADLRGLSEWQATPAQVRECVLSRHITGMTFNEDMLADPTAVVYMATQREVETINEDAHAAITSGRMIDFGHLPNDVIKQGGIRGSRLYDEGAIGHPFSESWVMFHTWEHGSCVYLIKPLDEDHPVGCSTEVCELQAFHVGEARRLLVIADRAILLTPDGNSPPGAKYTASSAPSPWRYMSGVSPEINNGMAPDVAAAANVLDPMMTGLLILHTKGIGRRTIEPSAKLNKARRSVGKPLIPPYDVVNSAPYVTALMQRRDRAQPQGGTHASPVTHIRMGHWRNYQSGHRTFILDTLVNASSEAREAFRSTRTGYEVRR